MSHKLLRSLRTEVVQFSSWLPTLMCLLNPSLKYRHWDSIKEQTGGKLTFNRDSNFTITDLKEIRVCITILHTFCCTIYIVVGNYLQIFEYHSTIALISNQANHEDTLENMLKKVWFLRL